MARNDFIWGAASAAYQVEGASATTVSGLSKWDVYTNRYRVTEAVVGMQQTGNVAINAYDREQYLQDIALMREARPRRLSLLDLVAAHPAGRHRRGEPGRARPLPALRRRSSRRRHQADGDPLSLGFPVGAAREGRLAQSAVGRLVPRVRRHRLPRPWRPRRHLHHLERAVRRSLLHGSRRRARARPARPTDASTERRVRPPGAGACTTSSSPTPHAVRDFHALGTGGHDRHRPAADRRPSPSTRTTPMTSPPPASPTACSTAGRSMPSFAAAIPTTPWRRSAPTIRDFAVSDGRPGCHRRPTRSISSASISMRRSTCRHDDGRGRSASAGRTPTPTRCKAFNGPVRPEEFYRLLMRLRADYGNPPVIITENGAGFGDVDEVVAGDTVKRPAAHRLHPPPCRGDAQGPARRRRRPRLHGVEPLRQFRMDSGLRRAASAWSTSISRPSAGSASRASTPIAR